MIGFILPLLALIVAPLLAALSVPAQEASAPRKLALLVGIDAYQEGVPALRGCVEDVRRVQRLLVERMGFAEADVHVLLDAEATHEAIVRAFDTWLLRRATSETEVLFWFSGHGSHVPDRDGEREEQDTTFLTADSRLAGRLGEYDFTDDELNSLLRALTALTPKVVIVTDSCHSGGGVRGASPVSTMRSVPAGIHPLDQRRLEGFWPSDLVLETGELDPERYVHIAACGPSQLAFEHSYQDLDGGLRRQGALSFFLLDGLERCAPGSTWRQLADEAAVRVSTRYPAQTVWYEGALDRQVFDAGFARAPEGFLGRHFGQRVVLEAGSLHGLQQGSRLIVRKNLAVAGEEEPLGEIEVTQVQATTAAARWIAAPADLDLGTPLRAVVLGRPSASRPLRVFTAPELEELLDEDLAELDAHRETAQLVLEESPLGLLHLADAAGHLIWTESEGEGAHRGQDLNGVLRRELLRHSLYELPNETGELQVAAHFEAPTEAEIARFHVPPAALEASRQNARGELVATGGASASAPTLAILVVRNEDSRPLHCTVLSLPENRRYATDQHAVEPIWPPNSRARDNLLAPGEEVRIPTGIVAAGDWDLERPLRDRFLVIALPTWADFSDYITSTRGAGDLGDLPGPLRSALAKRATRGVQAAPVGGKPWGVLAVDLLVVPTSPVPQEPKVEPQRPAKREAPATRGGGGESDGESAGTGAPAARWHALLVGCDEYPELRVAFPDRYEEEIRLQGPGNDVALMESVLREVFETPSERITVLTGWSEDASTRPTASNIDRGLAELGRRVGAGDQVLLYFSGHGSQQIDGTGEELDGLDEVFLPADVGAAADRSGRIPRALADDRIGRAASRLREAGASVWLVFDCCHSGTMARGGGVVRGLDPGLFGIQPSARGGLAGEESRALEAGGGKPGLVALYASESFARALEIDLPEAGGERHGLLTWSLAVELRKGVEGRTYRRLFADVTTAYSARAASDTVPTAEGELDRLIGTRLESAPSSEGALASGRLAVKVAGAQGGPLGALRRMLGEHPELFEMVEEAPVATVSLERGQFALSMAGAQLWGLAADEVLPRLAAYQLLTLLEQAGGAGESPQAARDFVCHVECRPLRGGSAITLEDGAVVHPGDRVRLRLAKSGDGLFDLFVLYADARLGITTLFPRAGASSRISGRLSEELELTGGWNTVTDDAQGAERIVVLAFPRTPGQPVVELGGLAWLAGARGDGGAFEELLDLLGGAGARGGEGLTLPRIDILRLRCEWPTLAAPPWPRRGVVEVTLPPPSPGAGAELDSLLRGTGIRRAALLRAPGSRDYDMLMLGDESAPSAVLFDLDGGRRERPTDAGLAELVSSGAFGAELVLHFLPERNVAFYDSTGDGILDLILIDEDHDGWADVRLHEGVAQPARVPLLSQSHLSAVLLSGAEPSQWTSRFSILAGSL